MSTKPPHTPRAEKKIVLVSGLSGAGKSLALKTLEDLGFETVDNMPLRLVPAMLSGPEALPEKLAMGIDVRNHDMSTHWGDTLASLRGAAGVESHILFLTADLPVLVRRFNETRRKHPLAGEGRPVAESLALEARLLEAVRDQADTTLDTSRLKPADLQRYLVARFGDENSGQLHVFIMSFGFKNGLPPEADLAFDVRFLRNPHWDDSLRPMTGLEAPVQAYIAADPNYATALQTYANLLRHQLPLHHLAGKAYMTVAVGCTGGKHRSVMMADALSRALGDLPFPIQVHHRDMPDRS